MRLHLLLGLALVLVGCSSEGSPAGPGGGKELPTGSDLPADPADFGAFLAAERYNDWDCEPELHPSQEPSPHGMNRICQNDIASAALDGEGNWPVGTAFVKEQFNAAGELGAISVSVRESDAEGSAGWRFYREANGAVTNNNTGQFFCTNCHDGADRDFVWSTVD